MGASCESCGGRATHAYQGSKVCESCYKAAAAADDHPNRIPADYDWDAEMNDRRIT